MKLDYRAAFLLCFLLLRPLTWAEEKPEAPVGTVTPVELRFEATDFEALVAAEGKRAVVTGTVVRTNHSQSGMNFLNFVDKIRTGFVVVVKAADVPKFGDIPPQYLYLKKRVQVTGTIAMYRAQPQIVIDSPNQIKVLAEEQGTKKTEE